MAGATFGTREKKSAKGKIKWYTTLSFDGRKTERFAGYKEADAYALGIKLVGEFNQSRAGILKNTKQPIHMALEKFVTRPGISVDTHELNEINLQSFIDDYPEIHDIKQINKDAVLTYLDDMRKKKYKDGYISLKLRTLKAFLNFCVEKGWLAFHTFPKKIIPKYFSKGHFFTEAERALLLAPTDETDPRLVEADKDLIRAITIAFHQGWREQTIWEMDWKHYRPQDNHYLVRGIKGAQDRWARLHPKTLKAMGEPKKVGRIFTRWSHPDALGHCFRSKRKRVGLTVGRFHDTKHTAVSSLEENGFTLTEVSEITNTSRAALIHYSHANQERLKKRFEDYTLSVPNPKPDSVQKTEHENI